MSKQNNKRSRFGRVYNRRPDKPDTRDFLYSVAMPDRAPAALPQSVDLRPGCSPVMDQGQVGSCTANSGCGDMEYLELQDLKKHVKNSPEIFDPANFQTHSRLFLYYNERLLMGTTMEDSGAEIRDTVKALQKFGTCPESLWPYNPNALFNKPAKTAYQVALQHRVQSYYRCLNETDIKKSLASGFPVMIGITIYESFESDDVASTGLVPMPDPSEQVLGGHAVLIVGYDDAKKLFTVRNSWGQSWGDKGYFYLPYSFMADASLASDFWTVRR